MSGRIFENIPHTGPEELLRDLAPVARFAARINIRGLL